MLLVKKQNWYGDQQQADGGDDPPGACWAAWSGVRSGLQKRPPAPGTQGLIEPCHGSMGCGSEGDTGEKWDCFSDQMAPKLI